MQKKIADRIELLCHFKELRPFSTFLLKKMITCYFMIYSVNDEMNKDLSFNKSYTKHFVSIMQEKYIQSG